MNQIPKTTRAVLHQFAYYVGNNSLLFFDKPKPEPQDPAWRKASSLLFQRGSIMGQLFRIFISQWQMQAGEVLNGSSALEAAAKWLRSVCDVQHKSEQAFAQADLQNKRDCGDFRDDIVKFFDLFGQGLLAPAVFVGTDYLAEVHDNPTDLQYIAAFFANGLDLDGNFHSTNAAQVFHRAAQYIRQNFCSGGDGMQVEFQAWEDELV